ncbi:MAG: hypothetical protein FRX49_09156 [Trebouxia sp. A1-2]|nr:MAG: hypothetical protein FRX49_09156 [Trebouxia sp. A1-2]
MAWAMNWMPSQVRQHGNGKSMARTKTAVTGWMWSCSGGGDEKRDLLPAVLQTNKEPHNWCQYNLLDDQAYLDQIMERGLHARHFERGLGCAPACPSSTPCSLSAIRQRTPKLGLLTADLRGTPAVLVLALLVAPSALSCLGALGLSSKLTKGSSEILACCLVPAGPEGLQSRRQMREEKKGNRTENSDTFQRRFNDKPSMIPAAQEGQLGTTPGACRIW